ALDSRRTAIRGVAADAAIAPLRIPGKFVHAAALVGAGLEYAGYRQPGAQRPDRLGMVRHLSSRLRARRRLHCPSHRDGRDDADLAAGGESRTESAGAVAGEAAAGERRRVMIAARALITMVAGAILAIGASCPPPGKPAIEDRWIPPSHVTDFRQLYAQNCAGCHGADGRLGGARPLNDPLYLAFAGADVLRQVTAKGVPGTAMPGFAQTSGGNLTDRQIDLLVEGMNAQWGRPENFKDVALPPYRPESAAAGAPQRGATAYQTYCSRCHGAEG